MDTLKNQIIDNIISILNPLRKDYPIEINNITNELIIGKTDSLNEFINMHYQDLGYRHEIKSFINNLIDNNLLDKSFSNYIKDNYQFINLKAINNILIDSKPLNVKTNILEKIKQNTQVETINNKYYDEIYLEDMSSNYTEGKTSNSDKLDSINYSNSNILNNERESNQQHSKIDIDDLRKKILDAQLNYINNASQFIKDLELEDPNIIYKSLIDLNDIRYIQHSLSKLSSNTLERFLPYVENKLELNEHSSIDKFMIEVIKKNLHNKMR